LLIRERYLAGAQGNQGEGERKQAVCCFHKYFV
jgi:hypothetical protein